MDRGSPAAARPWRSGRAPRRALAAAADVAIAQGLLLAALLRARLRPTGRLVAPAPGDGGSAPADRRTPEERVAGVERAVRAIDRASRRGLFRPSCLVRSLALARLLERWGVRGARIRIGVRPGEPAGAGMVTVEVPAGGTVRSGGGPRPDRGAPLAAPSRARLRAHAWVELDGRVIGDDPVHVARFSPLGSVASVRLRWR